VSSNNRQGLTMMLVCYEEIPK